jgi:hypothetical protein
MCIRRAAPKNNQHPGKPDYDAQTKECYVLAKQSDFGVSAESCDF